MRGGGGVLRVRLAKGIDGWEPMSAGRVYACMLDIAFNVLCIHSCDTALRPQLHVTSAGYAGLQVSRYNKKTIAGIIL